MAENARDADVDGAPPIGGKPSTDLLSAESARLPLALALLQVTGDVPLRWHTAGDLDACAGERAPHNWCIMLPVCVYYAVALFLQVRAAHPDLIQKHRGAGSLLLTPRLDTQATFETLSHAAGLTSHTTLLVFGKSGFIGQDEAGHGRSTVGLTSAPCGVARGTAKLSP